MHKTSKQEFSFQSPPNSLFICADINKCFTHPGGVRNFLTAWWEGKEGCGDQLLVAAVIGAGHWLVAAVDAGGAGGPAGGVQPSLKVSKTFYTHGVKLKRINFKWEGEMI